MFWIRENIVYEDGMEFSMMAEKKIAEIYCVDCGASSEDGLILDHKDKVIKLL